MTWVLRGEPELDLANIQAHILIGFGSTEQAVGAFTGSDLAALGNALSGWAKKGWITSSSELLSRKGKNARTFIASHPGPWIAASISERVLVACGLPHNFDDDWFSSSSMADITELADRRPADGSPLGSDWEVGSPSRPVDVLLIVGAGEASAASEILDWFLEAAGPNAEMVYREELKPIQGNIEHFGFRDGISQPGVLGLANGEPFESYRQSEDRPVPQAAPGQDLIWPGEFVFGYPRQGPVRKFSGPIAQTSDMATREITRNGSHLVFRRLTQDVDAFHSFCARVTAQLQAADHDVDESWLRGQLVGRWPQGVPLTDDPSVGFDESTANDFSFSNDEMDRRCPLGAHIRKVNPRLGDSNEPITPRIIRRGVPFGEPRKPDETVPAARGRGLAFVSYQTRIVKQFGTLMVDWMGDPSNPAGNGGHDMLVGQPAAGRQRQFNLPIAGAITPITADESWVHTTGGAFLFAPSIQTLKLLARKERP